MPQTPLLRTLIPTLAGLVLVLGLLACGEPEVRIPEAGSVEDLEATIEHLSKQISELESENARLRRQSRQAQGASAESDEDEETPAKRRTRRRGVDDDRRALEVVAIGGRSVTRRDDEWQWEWTLEVRNRSSKKREFDVDIQFLDRSGDTIYVDTIYSLSMESGKEIFEGSTWIHLPEPLRVDRLAAELRLR